MSIVYKYIGIPDGYGFFGICASIATNIAETSVSDPEKVHTVRLSARERQRLGP
jgi:hypothetical protein